MFWLRVLLWCILHVLWCDRIFRRMSTPTTVRQEPGGRDLSTSKSSRGPYRCREQIPRQTVHNRKRRKLMETAQQHLETTDLENGCQNISNSSGDTGLPTFDENIDDASSLHEYEAEDDNASSFSQNESPLSIPKLFPGSMLSSTTSHLLISSYMCRHHLSNQAQEDLLQLLQLHIPSNNLLPSSMYAFRKMSVSSNNIDLEPIAHFYCQRCYTILSEDAMTCPNQCCATSMCPQSTPSFITLSIADQLKILLERKLV